MKKIILFLFLIGSFSFGSGRRLSLPKVVFIEPGIRNNWQEGVAYKISPMRIVKSTVEISKIPACEDCENDIPNHDDYGLCNKSYYKLEFEDERNVYYYVIYDNKEERDRNYQKIMDKKNNEYI